MVFVNYQKRKNAELFKSLEDSDSLFLSNAQNYIPIYTRFFSLNDTNFNSINLNHKWYIYSLDKQNEENTNLYKCKINNLTTQKTIHKEVFFKLAPLLDPYKYLTGKYNINDEKIFNLPTLNSTADECHHKLLDANNSAYVDGLFIYLTSHLLHNNHFIHGLDYYGSILGIKNNYKINVFDDIDYLNNSDFFNNNKNILFKIDDYQYLFQNENNAKLEPITIQYNTSAKSQLSIKSFDNELFEGVFEDNTSSKNSSDVDDINVDIDELHEFTNDVDVTNTNTIDTENNNVVSLKSNSSCSSRSSYTDSNDSNDGNDECDNCGELETFDDDLNSDNTNSANDSESDSENESESDSDDASYEEEQIFATIPKFPIQVIGMEYCENTFDDLILNEDLTTEEWLSAFMQIIMILITYQKSFGFTHNDLHTNNVMYNKTDKKYIYYCYKKKYYKVPTFGRIFKIIDFGRSIYKFDGKLFCSDSFQIGGDAATQYNTEPYLNNKKPRLEPNFSFDLCRLACSIFDYVIDDFEEIKDISKCKDPIKRLIVEWCLDDKGINMLYKNNGTDRYPDFKLYKMIARCVHNHIPQAQLERSEFDAFSKFKGDVPDDVINIDNIPSYM
jgi:hypothetical protein